MKRKVIFGALAALFLGGGIFTAVNLTQKPVMSDLNLANIEAMTGGGADTSWRCFGDTGYCEKNKCGVCGSKGGGGKGHLQGSHSCYFD